MWFELLRLHKPEEHDFLPLCPSPGVVLCPDPRERSRRPDDRPAQPSQIPSHRHAGQLSRLQSPLPLSEGHAHELREALRGLVDDRGAPGQGSGVNDGSGRVWRAGSGAGGESVG